MFEKPGNYFLAISFQWAKILKFLDVPEKDCRHLMVSDRHRYESPNADSKEGLGIDEQNATFEYYILPNSLRNGSHMYSSIYDQQLKRFFESPNINYGPVLKHAKTDTTSIICLFSKNIIDKKAGFSIAFLNGEHTKTICILFDDVYLNLKDAHVNWSEEIAFESYEISNTGEEDLVKKVAINTDVIQVSTSLQSQNDAGMNPFSHSLNKFLEKN